VQDSSSDACSPEQWQVLVAALVAQVSFAGVTLHAMLAENGCQLHAAAAHSVLRGALWILFLVSSCSSQRFDSSCTQVSSPTASTASPTG
jgi:hypothetical protein